MTPESLIIAYLTTEKYKKKLFVTKDQTRIDATPQQTKLAEKIENAPGNNICEKIASISVGMEIDKNIGGEAKDLKLEKLDKYFDAIEGTLNKSIPGLDFSEIADHLQKLIEQGETMIDFYAIGNKVFLGISLRIVEKRVFFKKRKFCTIKHKLIY